MEVFPFTTISWRSREIQSKFDPVRSRIYQATHFAEYELVKRGLRDADVYQLDPDRFDNQIDRVMKDRLGYRKILRSKTYGGYGHRHYTTDKIDSDTFIYGVVAKTQDLADEFWRANESPINHKKIGLMLGYPECDVDFFSSVWLKDRNLDPMYEMALNTENAEIKGSIAKVSGPPELNRLIRYWGFNIIPHFPHSFDCKEAQKVAQLWLQLMREHDEEATETCLEILNMPMVWSLQNCITYVEHPLFIGAANGYYTDEKKVVQWLP